ncbi:leucine zipper domain-containing protein [Xylophilus sp. Leaf220]|uniref:leucine zipper domain-containing protein n=1 Tax=Xylophilus sp. Leaf220 TaxID=1735686 RepID=UPI00191BEBBD
MVHHITERGASAADAALKHGVSAVTARKWLVRYFADGAAGLLDKFLRPREVSAEHRPTGTGHRRAATQAHPVSAHRVVHGRVPGHRQPGTASSRPLATERPAPERAGPALRTRMLRRVAAHRHQEARTLQQGRPPHHRRPHPASAKYRLRLRLRGCGPPQSHGVHVALPGRYPAQHRSVPAGGRRLLRMSARPSSE